MMQTPSEDPTLWEWLQLPDKAGANARQASPVKINALPLISIFLVIGLHYMLRHALLPTPFGYLLYGAALALVAVVLLRTLPIQTAKEKPPLEFWLPEVRLHFFALSLVLAIVAFLFVPNNQFTVLGGLAWIASVACLLLACWQGGETIQTPVVRQSGWGILLAGIALLLAAIFRLSWLDLVPLEMTSDHIEKLLDIQKMLTGDRPIFMRNNGGRESMQFYLTFGATKFLGLPLNHLTLKRLMASAGLLTVPIIYLLAKEVTEKGLLAGGATLLAAVAWWPNVIGRNGLRFPLAPLFAALTTYFLVRAIKRDSFNALLLAGLCCGIGLYGYTSIRVMPLIMVWGIGLAWMHLRAQSKVANVAQIVGLMSVFVVLLMFLPMLRYSFDDPVGFWHRTLTRMTEAETALQTSAFATFLTNVGRALTMFLDQADQAWFTTPAKQPALDWLTGALFYIGWVTALIHWIKNRNWAYGFITSAVILALLPSMLALAFPSENPSVTRAGVALPFVFVIAAIGAETVWKLLRQTLTGHKGLLIARLVFALGFAFIGIRNYNIVFTDYSRQYAQTAPNSREMAAYLQYYATEQGNWESAWVIAYPHWIDTRSIGFHAQNPVWHNVILPDDILFRLPEIADQDTDTKLFMYSVEDVTTFDTLQTLFPTGVSRRFESHLGENKDFMIFFVN